MSFSHNTSNDDDNKIFVNFNQDFSSISVGTKNGCRLYDLKKIDKLDLLYQDNSDYMCIMERLFQSSLLAYGSLSSPRKLNVLHYKKKNVIVSHSYMNTILSVKLNRARLAVCLEDGIYIHDMGNLQLMHTIKLTARNPTGLIALSPSHENSLLAYPAKNTCGEVNIYDAFKLEDKFTIPAHDNPLAAMAFNFPGTKLATASERGTVIRVFETVKGDCLYEFRRGYARCVSIYSLAFSLDSLFLIASSNTETVHIFKLTESKPQEEDLYDIFKSGVKKMLQSASYLNGVAEMMNQWRSFATVKLPLHGPKTLAAITNSFSKTPHVVIASTEGYLYVYDLNVVDGGDCTLIRQHRLVDNNINHESTSAQNNEN